MLVENIYYIIGPNWSHAILVRDDGIITHGAYALKCLGIKAGVSFEKTQELARQNGWRIAPEETVDES